MEPSDKNIEQHLCSLIESGDEVNWTLASQLVKGLGYEEQWIEKILQKVTDNFLEAYFPDMDFHHFGCSLLEKKTFELVLNKLNEYFDVAQMEVAICSDYVKLYCPIFTPQPAIKKRVEISLNYLSHHLHYSVRSSFVIKKERLC